MTIEIYTVQAENAPGLRWVCGLVLCWMCSFQWVSVRPSLMFDLVSCPTCGDFTGMSLESVKKAITRTQ